MGAGVLGTLWFNAERSNFTGVVILLLGFVIAVVATKYAVKPFVRFFNS